VAYVGHVTGGDEVTECNKVKRVHHVWNWSSQFSVSTAKVCYHSTWATETA